jgi:hypothetical protein
MSPLQSNPRNAIALIYKKKLTGFRTEETAVFHSSEQSACKVTHSLALLDMGGRQRMPLTRGAKGARKVGQNRLFWPSKTKKRPELFDIILYSIPQLHKQYPKKSEAHVYSYAPQVNKGESSSLGFRKSN